MVNYCRKLPASITETYHSPVFVRHVAQRGSACRTMAQRMPNHRRAHANFLLVVIMATDQ
jgi:hypothetical protein